MSSRREKLAALKSAVEEWADKEEERLSDEVDFLESVISGRTSSGRVVATVNRETTQLIQNQISDFLEGES